MNTSMTIPDAVCEAIELMAHGQYEAAAIQCEQEIEQHPTQLVYYWYLGLIRLLQGDEEEAQATWLAAMAAADPETIESEITELLHILQVEAEHQLQSRPDLTEQICCQILDLDREQPIVHFQLGNAIALQGRFEEAIIHWQMAIELQPDFAAAFSQQAIIFHKLAQLNEAIAAYQQAIDLESTWQLHYQLGLCFSDQQQWQEALLHFKQAIELCPISARLELAAIYGDRGWAYLRQGQRQQAIADFLMVQRLSGYAEIYNSWVDTLSESVCSSTIVENAKFLQLLSEQSILEISDTESVCQALGQLIKHHQIQQIAQQTHQTDTVLVEASPPIGYYETTEDWIKAEAIPNYYSPLDPPELVSLTPPKTIDREVHFSFRFGRAIQLPGAFVVTLPQGQFWLNSSETASAILTNHNQLLGDLSPEFPLLSPGHPDKHPSQHSLFSLKSLLPAQKLEGKVAVLSGLTNDMYFHWLFDVLPRFDLLHRSGINFDQIDGFVVSNHLSFQQETLENLGVPRNKILPTRKHLHIQANELVVPSYPSTPAWMPRWVCEWLRQVFLSQNLPSSGTSDRLYITRQNTGNRRLINESEIIEFLGKFGFKAVTLESISVMEQATLLANASVVIAPHGGGLTNIVFCSPQTKIIELFSPNYVYPCYWLISNHLDLDYYYLAGRIPTGNYLHQLLYADPRLEDIWICLDDLKQLLIKAGVI